MQKSLKRYTVTGIVLTIIAGMAAHFIYQWSDENLVAALFVPVNESVWEHLKLLFFPMVIYSIFETLLLHNDFPELFYADAIGIFIGMLSIVVLFYTYSGVLGRNCTPVDIGIFCFSVILAFLTRYFLVQKKIGLHQWKWLILSGLVACTIAFFSFTWNPPAIGLFRNPEPAAAAAFLGFPFK